MAEVLLEVCNILAVGQAVQVAFLQQRAKCLQEELHSIM